VALWTRLVSEHGSAPEAPEADLEWARALRRAGRSAEAAARLEHLILTYPDSALVAQARRELESIRNGQVASD
jgi:TolA-binding protein